MKVVAHPALPFLLALVLSSSGLVAQKSGGGGGGKGVSTAPAISPSTSPNYNPVSRPSWMDYYSLPTPTPTPALKNEEPPCIRWPMNPFLSAMVSVSRLDVPPRAKKEFQAACEAARHNDHSRALQSLNRATTLYPNFADAWVLLGQIQGDDLKLEEARQSCNQAHDSDSSYIPAYLCLADLAVRQGQWTLVADLTNKAIASHPVRAPGAYFDNSLAYYHMGQLTLAEKSGLRALADPAPEHKPSIHWLLAKIYETKGDRASEAEQLREYLKLAPHSPESAAAQQVLRQIESQQATADSSTTKSPPPIK